MSGKIITRLACAALAATFITTIDVPVAEAQRRTLLEQWFPRAAERQRQLRVERLRRTQPELFARERPVRKPAPIKKVTGPQYYTYKTETLSVLALAAALPIVEQIMPVNSNALLGEDDLGVESTGDIDAASTGTIERAPHVLRAEALEGWSMKVEAGISEALKGHYSKSPEYLWVDRDFKPTPDAEKILAVFKRADEYGLLPGDYAVEEMTGGAIGQLGAEKAAARFELELSAAILRYGADASSGRINPNGLSGYHDFPNYKRDYPQIAEKIFGAGDASAALEAMHPNNPKFASLIGELAELRGQLTEDTLEPVAPGTFFRPGQENAEVPKVVALIAKKASDELKQTHAETLASYDGRIVFDEPLVALVRDFQKENGLGADGIVGKNTIAKLATVSPKAKMAKIELAMERLRWHPHDLGEDHVFINQPAYRVNYVNDGKTELAMNVVVGTPENQTYFFHDKIEIVEVNPYWNVPRSILVNEMLGKIRSNPGYLSARNYEVVTAGGVTNPYNVDWYGNTNGVYVRQKPGGANALGELKILFPNKHAIYMHDTPAKNLFSRTNRAYSHGCVRLADPRAMAAAVLGTSKEQVGSYIAGGKNRSIKVDRKLPVYVAYFTAWPDESGKVNYYADVYGRDKALTEAIERTGELRNSVSASAS